MPIGEQTGLQYPDPTTPSDLEHSFSELRVGDPVILYNRYHLCKLLVTLRTDTHIYVAHVGRGFGITDGKARDERGAVIDKWQLLPFTDEIQAAFQHARKVNQVERRLRMQMRFLAAMTQEQLQEVERLFDQAASQEPVHPLVMLIDE